VNKHSRPKILDGHDGKRGGIGWLPLWRKGGGGLIEKEGEKRDGPKREITVSKKNESSPRHSLENGIVPETLPLSRNSPRFVGEKERSIKIRRKS